MSGTTPYWLEVLEAATECNDLEKAANYYARLFFIDSMRDKKYNTLYKYPYYKNRAFRDKFRHEPMSASRRLIKFENLQINALITIFSYLDISFFT